MAERLPEPQWLDDEEMGAWLALNGVILLLPGALDSQMQRDNGLTMFEYGTDSSPSTDHPTRSCSRTTLRTVSSASRPFTSRRASSTSCSSTPTTQGEGWAGGCSRLPMT